MKIVETGRDRLISLEEAGRITGLGRSSLYERLGKDFVAVKVGRRRLFSEQECFAFVQERLQEARQSA